MYRRKRWILLLGLIACFALEGRAQNEEQTKQFAREIFKQLIEINTTDSVGNVTTAAEAMAKRLTASTSMPENSKKTKASACLREFKPVRKFMPIINSNR